MTHARSSFLLFPTWAIAVVVFIWLILWLGAAQAFQREVGGISYKRIPGIDPGLTELDIYPVAQNKRAPVVVFVHGGSWHSGDKSNVQRAASLRDFFERNGIVLVAINLRLVENPGSPGTTFRDQAADVASAIRWVRDNIAEYGGDPGNISLMGFSSGAHLAALVGTDDGYLRAEGLSPSSIKGIMAFDVDAYDIPRAIKEGSSYDWAPAAENLPRVFSHDVGAQDDASPIRFVKSSKHYPPFLIIYSGVVKNGSQRLSQRQSELFADALKKAGVPVTVYGAPEARHVELVMKLGRSDFGVTKAVQTFLDRYVK